MSKRTPGLPQRPNGFWPTPKSAIAPLVPWLPRRAAYGEPCAGDGAIVAGLADLWPGGCCVWQSDLAPQARGIEAPRREHSRKPDETHLRIQQLVSGPYLELFAREARPGWAVWGNQADKFTGAA